MKDSFDTRFFHGGVLSLAKLLTGLAKIKILAISLGVEGVGILSLALQFQTVAVSLVSMSLAVGVINLGRPRWLEGKVSDVGAIVGTAFFMVGLNSVIFIFLFLLLNDTISSCLSGSTSEQFSIWPIVIAAVFVSFANAIGEGIFYLVDRFDLYVRANICASVADVVFITIGAWFFGLEGVLVAVLASGVFLIAVYFLIARGFCFSRDIVGEMTWGKEWVRPLFSYSSLMVGTIGFGLAAVFFARALLIANAGVEANGLLQVVTALAAYFLPFVMTGVWGHLHPYVAAGGDSEGARGELRKTLLNVVRFAVAGCSAIVITAPVLVPIVYTKDFLAALPYINIYFIGELFFIWISVFGVYLLSAGLRLAYLVGYLGYYSLLLAGVILGVEQFGIWAYVGAHLLASTVVSIAAGYYSLSRKQVGLREIAIIVLWAMPLVFVCLSNLFPVKFEIHNILFDVSTVSGLAVIVVALAPQMIKSLKKYSLAGLD